MLFIHLYHFMYTGATDTCLLKATRLDIPVADQPGRRTLRSGGTNRLMVPSVRRSTVGDQAFTVAGPRVWNTLPEEITTSQTLSSLPSVNNLKPGSSENHIRTLSSEPAFLIQTINLEVDLLHRQSLID